jgi:hypothetical protein
MYIVLLKIIFSENFSIETRAETEKLLYAMGAPENLTNWVCKLTSNKKYRLVDMIPQDVYKLDLLYNQSYRATLESWLDSLYTELRQSITKRPTRELTTHENDPDNLNYHLQCKTFFPSMKGRENLLVVHLKYVDVLFFNMKYVQKFDSKELLASLIFDSKELLGSIAERAGESCPKLQLKEIRVYILISLLLAYDLDAASLYDAAKKFYGSRKSIQIFIMTRTAQACPDLGQSDSQDFAAANLAVFPAQKRYNCDGCP